MGAFRWRAPYYAQASFEGTLLLLGAWALVTVLVQRRVVPEEGLDVGPLLNGTPQGLDAMASGVRVAQSGPAEGERTDGALALEKKTLRFLGFQMRRDAAHRLQVLPADDAVVRLLVELGFKPRRAHEGNIAESERLGQILVELAQLELHLGIELDEPWPVSKVAAELEEASEAEPEPEPGNGEGVGCGTGGGSIGGRGIGLRCSHLRARCRLRC